MYIVFQTVFCATAATIVSGSMAERTNFKACCVYSAAISLVVYPICGHWMWGGGWLQRMGFHDFAGSAGRGVSVPLISSLSRRDGVDILFSFFLFSDNSNHSSKPRSFTQGSGALAFLDSARPSCYLCGQDIKNTGVSS